MLSCLSGGVGGDLRVMDIPGLNAKEVFESVGVGSAVVDNLADARVLQNLLRKGHR